MSVLGEFFSSLCRALCSCLTQRTSSCRTESAEKFGWGSDKEGSFKKNVWRRSSKLHHETLVIDSSFGEEEKHIDPTQQPVHSIIACKTLITSPPSTLTASVSGRMWWRCGEVPTKTTMCGTGAAQGAERSVTRGEGVL